MTVPEPTTSGTENSAESSEERLFMAQFTALQTWLCKNDDKYPKRRSSDEEETKLANFIKKHETSTAKKRVECIEKATIRNTATLAVAANTVRKTICGCVPEV